MKIELEIQSNNCIEVKDCTTQFENYRMENPLMAKSGKRKLSKFEQYDFYYDEFIKTVRIHKLIHVGVLFDFFNVDRYTESNIFPKNGESFKPINNFYILIVDYSYFLVGLEIYSEDNKHYLPRFLTEIGYTVSDVVAPTAVKRQFVYNSLEELSNSILEYKKRIEFPCFVV